MKYQLIYTKTNNPEIRDVTTRMIWVISKSRIRERTRFLFREKILNLNYF